MLMIETQRRISWHQLAVVTPAVVICCYTPLRGFEPRGRYTKLVAMALSASITSGAPSSPFAFLRSNV